MKKYFQTTFRLWKLLKDFHKDFYFQLFCIISQQLINVYTIYLTAHILNELIVQNYTEAYNTCFIIFGLWTLRTIISYFSTKNNMKNLESSVNTYLQEYSLRKILNLNPSQYIEDHSAIKLTVVNRGEQAIKSIISSIVLNLIPVIFQTIFSLIAIMFYSIIVGSIAIATFVIAIIWSILFTRYHRPFIKKNMDNWDNYSRVRTETFQHFSLIKNSGIEDKYIKKYISGRWEVVKYHLFTWNKNINNGHIRAMYFSSSRILIILTLIYQVSMGKILVGSIYAIWSWVNDIFNNINSVTQAMRDIPQNFVELEKYLDIIDKEPEFDESGIKKYENGDIKFENISFKYPKGENYIIENLNIIIPQSKKVAFVGFSGSGKSTIIKLLLRMYDWNNGDIKIGNKSLRNIDAQTLRQKIGYVEQHVDLFDTTIKENLLFGISTKKISESDLNVIIHKARIDQFFHRLGESGLNTLIGERGVKLSGGERQRIGIARALVKDPEILIFDEATASLDTENEKYIQEAIDESSKGRTTIIIAHRLSTIVNADLIFVMDKGKVVSSGTHHELLNSSPEYLRLVHAQNN